MSDWRPIETAPKDGTYVVLVGALPDRDGRAQPRRACVSRWYETAESPFYCVGWPFVAPGFVDRFIPTHWMPLPEPREVA